MSTGEKILRFLADNGPCYGLAIVQDGICSRGSVYVHLSRLEEQGFVVSWEEEPFVPDWPKRRKYRITAVGRRVI